jgi:hypothetical protein
MPGTKVDDCPEVSGSNAARKILYERLRAKGKTGKQALIAVCNKLLFRSFGTSICSSKKQ